MSNSENILQELQEARARTYLFFGGFFDKDRTKKSLDLLKAVILLTEEETKEAGLNWKKPENISSETDTLQLEVEFSKLFYGVGKETIPLSESAHFDEHHLLCQNAYASVKNIYRKNGFSIEDDYEMQADSLAVELAFASVLVEQKAANQELLGFLDEHLFSLAEIVCNSLLSLTNNPILLAIAQTLPSFLQAEKKLLSQSKG